MLSVKDLHVYYGGVHALKGLSIEVPDGSIVALLGANGAGKTTALHSICGLVQARSGGIYFQNDNMAGVPAYQRVQQGIAMVPEGRRVFTNLSVYENLLMGAYTRNDEDGIQEDLGRVYRLFPQMKDRLSQRAGTLSGGEQQMLAVGRALMSSPKLLLLDEPSLGLAPTLTNDLFRTIEEIHQQGTTILLVEQNARAAFRVADYGYVMEIGRVIVEGPTAELRENRLVRQAYLGTD